MLIHRHHLFLCFVLLLQFSSTSRADATYLQPDTVYLGDITQLVIEYDSGIPSLYSLNTSALETDFEVLDKKSRIFRLTETDEANRVIHRMQWRLNLLPRRIGKLKVPALQFSDKSTLPLTLQVEPVPPSLQASRQVFVEIKADTRNPYLGQQTQVTMQLYHNTPVTDGRLFEPQTSDAQVHRQLQERSFRVDRNGQVFDVLERDIALFPQNAGEFQVSPASYRGSIDAGPKASQTGSANSMRHILRRSQPLKLQVRNPPADFNGRFWLPATGIELTQRWNETDKVLRVGESIDWTLTIIARGLPAESLPQNLLSMEAKNFSIYADQPTRSNRFDGRQIVGRLEQRFVVVASEPGEIVLPAAELKWWDVVSDSEKRVQLEGKTINVSQALVAADDPTRLTRQAFAGWWMNLDSGQWISLSILLGILFLMIKLLPRRIVELVKPVRHKRRLRQRLKQSCLSGDAAAARVALIEWGRARWPADTINGLKLIDRQMASPDFSEKLKQLDAALYSRHQGDWDGEALWRQIDALKASSPRIKPQPRDHLLPRIYPL